MRRVAFAEGQGYAVGVEELVLCIRSVLSSADTGERSLAHGGISLR